jgi:hypothetical protein
MQVDNTAVDLTLMTDLEINDDSVAYRALYDYLIEWAKVGDLKEIRFTQDGGDPLLYAWRVERNNLRVLDSVFLFDSATDLDPDVTIALPQSWPLSVIINGGKTRGQLINIRADFGLTSFVVVFL